MCFKGKDDDSSPLAGTAELRPEARSGSQSSALSGTLGQPLSQASKEM